MAASRTLLHKELANRNFSLDVECIGTNERSDFHELQQQHNQLKTMKTNETWPDIYDDGYIHPFQPRFTRKNSGIAAKTFSDKKHLSNDCKDL